MHSTSHAPTARRLRRLAPLLAIPVSLMMVDTAIAAQKVMVKSTGDLQRALPATGVQSQPLTIKPKGTITDVDVVLAMDTEANQYSSFYLRHPSGRMVLLSSGNGGFGDGYGSLDGQGCELPMKFDDEAPENISETVDSNGAISGAHQPQEKQEGVATSGLGRLDGLRTDGRWELIVANAGVASVLECVKLRITYKPA